MYKEFMQGILSKWINLYPDYFPIVKDITGNEDGYDKAVLEMTGLIVSYHAGRKCTLVSYGRLFQTILSTSCNDSMCHPLINTVLVTKCIAILSHIFTIVKVDTEKCNAVCKNIGDFLLPKPS